VACDASKKELEPVAATGCRVGRNESRRTVKMEPKKFSLCPLCTECPEVVITDEGVTIGEDANTVRLSHAEWNELVSLIKRGEVGEI
jgi:hypothetical protein